MTYVFSGSRYQDGDANVTGRFSYEENLPYPHFEANHEQKWKDQREIIRQRRTKRQKNIGKTIRAFLKSRHNARGLKGCNISVNDDSFLIHNYTSKADRCYSASSNGNNYDIEVSGRLKPSEHLEDMLDCEALDAQLKVFFEK